MPWYVNRKEGQQNSATISYSSVTKNLSVVFTSYDDLRGVQVISHLSRKVDLKRYLPDWVVVGFSASKGRSIILHNIISWKFSSSALLDYDLSLGPAPDLSSVVRPTKDKRNLAAVIGGVVGGFMLVAVLGLGLFNSCKRKATGESSTTEIQGLRRFSYREITLATRNFSEGEKLGEGVDGDVYKGFRYDMNSYVTVKRMSKGSTQRKGYKAELRILSKLHHRNLMALIGWCDEQGELILVYEFMANGSLDLNLHKAENLLIWEVRYNIARELASALLFLHQIPCVLNMNIQPSNIMLDSTLRAKLGYFLFSELVHENSQTTDLVIGALDNIVPAYFTTIKATKMSDVYSFGVVALEVASGRKPIDSSKLGYQFSLVEWIWELYREGKIIEAADPKLRGEFDEKQMECLLVVGLWCAHSDFRVRPSINEAILVLNFEAPLPLLFLSNDTTTGLSSERSTSASSNF